MVYEAATFSPGPLVELSAYHHMISVAVSCGVPVTPVSTLGANLGLGNVPFFLPPKNKNLIIGVFSVYLHLEPSNGKPKGKAKVLQCQMWTLSMLASLNRGLLISTW